MILSLFNYQPLTYHNGSYKYPNWAHYIGWSITAFTILCIPAFALFNIFRAEGSTFYEVTQPRQQTKV